MRLVFALLLSSLSVAPAVAADEPAVRNDLWPLAIGNRWVYRLPGQEDRLTITAVAAETIGDVRCIKLEGRMQLRVIATEHVAVRKDGIYLYRNNGIDLEPPLLMCKLPSEKGGAWRADYKIHDKQATLVYACDKEDVHVPAGRFRAVVVRSTSADSGVRLQNTVWYAPRIGMVKQVIVDGEHTITLSLERFERGDKEQPMFKMPPRKGPR